MRVAVSAGHYPTKPGFSKNNLHEYGECSIIAGLVVRQLELFNYETWFIGTGTLQEKVAQINKLKCNCGLEIHLNAGGGEGAETLYNHNSVIGKSLAKSVQNNLRAVASKDRGIKEGWYRMDRPGVIDYPGDLDGDESPDYILSKTNCPFVIVEPFFLDKEFDVYVAKLDKYMEIALAIALGIKLWVPPSK